MRTMKILFLGHLAALIFGLGGLLIALPHPELWDTNPNAIPVFNFGITYAGSLHILFGAATMLLFGLLCIGTRKTLIFFAAATTISLSMELIGTSTGFPFGAYSYTSFLGFKIANHVPYSIPLSWFYMGFTSLILASIIVKRVAQRHNTAWSLVLGAYFLTVWDLALDPAMASQNLPIHFWIWHVTGPYFGMPVQNLVGWSVTGLIFMSVSRLFWRTNLDTQHLPAWLPFGMYAANIGFAIALNINADLWIPPVMAVVLGIAPAALVFRRRRPQSTPSTTKNTNPVVSRISQIVVQKGSWMLAHRDVKIAVEGMEHVPHTGPVLIVARHFHHLYDGCVLLKTIPHPLHILVALDWVQKPWLRTVMERACTLVSWPILLRVEQLNTRTNQHAGEGQGAYSRAEAQKYLRQAIRDSVQLLRNREILVVFPEAYPNVDPAFTPKENDEAFLPFRQGFARVVEMAERDGHTQVAIIPTGFTYAHNNDKWQITVRFGPALSRNDYGTSAQLVQAVEQQVQSLSHHTTSSILAHTEEILQL
ncbi:MAG TPA: carotenoid biosynthesis protein [Ktedonobacteraceae bacterium]|nr:carotenoid biosynthesis protein [Ktedonobacteraceae bacterium]